MYMYSEYEINILLLLLHRLPVSPHPFTPLSDSIYLEINETAWLTNNEG